MEERLPRKLAAILYADVAGYSRLTGEDEEGTHRALSTCLDALAHAIEQHQGKVLHFAGDAVLAEFASVVNALTCAVAIQHDLKACNEGLPDDRKLQIRIGINVGDVIVDRNEIYGDGVNVATRLESLAAAGGICISDMVRQGVEGKLDLDLEDLGEQQVKNIDKPVRAYRVRFEWDVKPERPPSPSSLQLSDKPSIAVLPFVNMSDDPEHEYFSDGITEDIITGLGRFRELFVIARGSSFAYKNRSVDIAEAADELGVQYVVEGSARKAGNRVRVTVQLIDAETRRHLWADSYDGVLEDVFAVQDDVAQRIVSTLAGRLAEAGRERALKKGTANPSAYDYLLRGKHYFADWHASKDDVLRAQEMFERAVELDPDYAAAYVGLAATYLTEFESGWTATPEVTAERAIEFARRAVEIDDLDSNAHLILASAYFRVKSNIELAQTQIDRALELNPNDYWNYCFKSWFLTCCGKLDEGISCGNEAIRLNPFAHDGCLWTLGFAEYFAGHYERAIATFGKISKPDPEVEACLAACYAQLGRGDEARAATTEFRRRAKAELATPPEHDAESWQAYWSNLFRFKDRAALEHLFDGLRKAGLLE